jgi:hypothetical protein
LPDQPRWAAPTFSELYADALIRDKVVVTFLDALILQYAGGPFQPKFFHPKFYDLREQGPGRHRRDCRPLDRRGADRK